MRLPRALLLLLPALIGASAGLPARAAETVGVRAAEHDREGFGRLVFDWPAPVGFEAKIEGQTLTIRFARPLTAKFDAVRSHLDGYIAAIRLAEGNSVVAELKQPATLHSFTDGNAVAIDIITGGKPAKAAARKQPATAPAARDTGAESGEAETVRLRFGEHAGFRRVVFDWHDPVRYALTAKAGAARLRFERAGQIDVARIAAELPALAPQIENAGDATVLSFSLPAGMELKHFASGKSVVLDIVGAAAPPRPAKARAAAGVLPPPELIEPAAGGPENDPKPALAPPRPLTRPSSSAAPPPGSLPVHVTLAPQGASLRFDWPKPVAAAAFRRGPALWLVFTGAKLLDLTEPRRLPGDLVRRIDQLPDAKATVLRLVTRPGLNPSLRRAENAWIVDLKPQEPRLDAPIAVDARPDAATPDVLFEVHDAADPIYLRDPEVGDTLAVVAVGELGRGVGLEQDYVDFQLLASMLGIVLRPKADDLRVQRSETGVSVTRPGGLLLSPSADRQLAREPGALGRLFDFASWRGPADQSFLAKRSRLEQAVAAAPLAYRSKPRLALARFYFANEMAPEALGVLEAIQHDDPGFAADPSVLLMLGAVHLMDGDQKSAAQELGQERLNNEPEAQLWRASLSAELGDWKLAAHGFALAANLLPRYPAALRDHFALQAAEAFLETGQPAEAQAMTQLVLKSNPPKADKAMALYLEGRRQLAQGDYNRAIETWNEVIGMNDRPSRARALYARIMAELDAKQLKRADAIKALDQMRFAWRGDLFEFTLLRKLGELKLADGDQRGAFDVLREAADNFQDYPQAKEVMKQLSDALADMVLGKGFEDVPPLKAVSLYDEFKDYAPAGERGDAIVRRLVDRLVAVDLLDRAAALLEDQVTHRLTGRDKARVATQLALLRLLDNNAAGALKALDIDVGKDVPAELQRQRTQLRARALAELNRSDEALSLLANDSSRDADRLRADIYWRARDWTEAAKIFARLVPPPAADAALDKASAQLVLNWAAALTLAGDQAGLAHLRASYGKAMAQTALANAFGIIAADSAAPAEGDPRAIANSVAQVQELQSFMASYKERLQKDRLSAIN
jgi:hypothetical protein